MGGGHSAHLKISQGRTQPKIFETKVQETAPEEGKEEMYVGEEEEAGRRRDAGKSNRQRRRRRNSMRTWGRG